jgi:pilus assembly protein CpaB
MLKGKMPLVIAGVLAAIAFGVSWSAINKQANDARKGWVLVRVVVAATEISEGTVITTDLINSRAIPEQFVTASVVKPDSFNYVLNQKVMVALQPGDPLLWSQFDSTAKASERLSKKVPKKMRALTIEAKGATAVGGWVRPNDQIDIIGTFKDPDTNLPIAVTLMQKVTVLATGKITGTTNINLMPENERTYGNVSLMLMPEEAEILVLGQELGSLTMSLRNEEDLQTIDSHDTRTTIKTLLSGVRTKELERKRLEQVEIIRGSTKTERTPHGPGENH